MKKIILMLLLVAMSTGAMAEWIEFASNENNDFYSDPSRIQREKGMAKIWVLTDKELASPDTAKSRISLFMVDCKQDKTAILSNTVYSERMAKGKVVNTYSNEQIEWSYVIPGTVSESLAWLACGKTKLKK